MRGEVGRVVAGVATVWQAGLAVVATGAPKKKKFWGGPGGGGGGPCVADLESKK